MGSKRPSDGEDLARLPFKHARSNDSDKMLISFSNVSSRVGVGQKYDLLGCYYGNICIPPHLEEWQPGCVESSSFSFEKDTGSSVTLSTVTGNLCDDESSQESDLQTVSFPFDHYPIKLVPIGRDHQADIPEWKPYINKTSSSSVDMGTSLVEFDEGDAGKYMGTCIIQMPDNAVLQSSAELGHNACECICSDSGSVGCVRQHIKETQVSLLNSLGKDRYVDLGFLEMGEEVAHGWSVEEEQVFSEVVYMNPMSLRKNFWHCLSKKFPSRSQKELVSYYYNVFMLRIRATQNRCHKLEIDSDDEEWHGETPYSSAVDGDEGEGSQLQSALDQDNDIYSDDDDRNREFSDNVSGVDLQFIHKDMNFTRGYQCSNQGSGRYGNAYYYTSGSDNATYPSILYHPSESKSGSKDSEVSSTTCYHSEGSVSGIDLRLGLYDSHESLMWGIDTFTSSLELLPTNIMIEEIFGSGSCGEKSTDDHSPR